MRFLICLCVVFAFLTNVARAQDDSENSYIVNLIQDGLSNEDRQIRLSGIEGLLASEATVEAITVADTTGVWLTISDAKIVWSRLALLRGRLEIDSLTAAKIDIARKPISKPSLPSPEAKTISIPELPLSVNIEALSVDRISIDKSVAGQSAELAVNGALGLADGGLDALLNIERLDMAGARISLSAQYAPGGEAVSINLDASEPENGLIANMLGIPNRPALDLTLKGEGPVTDLRLDLDLLANKLRQVEGTIRLDDAPGGLGFDADLSGRLAFLVSGEMRHFFKGESTMKVVGQQLAGGGLAMEEMSITTASFQLNGGFETTPDGFLRRAKVNGQLGDQISQTILPFGTGNTSIREARIVLDFGQDGSDTWDGAIVGTALIAGGVSAAEFGIDLGGTARNLEDPETRLVTLNATGGFRGMRGATPDLTRALGRNLDINVSTVWKAGSPFEIDEARIDGNGTSIDLIGTLDKLQFSGQAGVRISRLEPFAGLVGRDLRGALALSLSGDVAPLTGAFDLNMSGNSTSLKLDAGQVDALLAGNTALSGRVARDQEGIRTNDLRLKNDQLDFKSDGFLASDAADLKFEVVLAELRDLTRGASGEVRIVGSAKGTGGKIALKSEIIVDEAELLDRPLTRTRAGFTGTMENQSIDGFLSGGGRFADGRLSLAGNVSVSATAQSIQNLALRVGKSTLTGDVIRDSAGLINGAAKFDTDDISDLAALALMEAEGAVSASLTFLPNGLGQQVTATGRIADLALPRAFISTADLRMIVQNAFGVPAVLGSIDFGGADIAGIAIRRGRAGAGVEGDATSFDADIDLTNGTAVGVHGSLTALATGYALSLDKLALDSDGPDISLAQPAVLTVEDTGIAIEKFILAVGEGRIDALGRIDETLDVALDLSDVPLSVANAVLDDLGVQGNLTATARITGEPANPNIVFDAKAGAVTSILLRENDLPPFDLVAKGQTEGGGLRIVSTLLGPNNFDADLSGYVPLDGGQLDLQGNLNRFPLALVDRVSGRQGLRGTIDGDFGVAGRLNRPRVRFNLDGQGLTANVVRQNGIPPFTASLEGSFANDTVILSSARVQGGNGMNFTASGRVPLLLDGLDMAVDGIVPLGVANVAMARSGIRAQGTVDIDMRATGRVTAPILSGRAALSGATVTASRINLRLEDVAAVLDLTGERITVQSMSARGSRGGRIEASGTVSVSTRTGMPSDIRLSLQDLDYTDAKLVATTINGDLQLGGTLLRNPVLSGNLTVSPLEITIPNRLPQSSGFSIEVRHVNATPQIARTLSRAQSNLPTSDSDTESGTVTLDITVNAPNRVFVRGRGLDAELGGQIQVTGTLPNYKPNGRFDLIRGRLALLGQRIDLNSGAIILTGSKIPDILMEARVVTDEVEATFNMEGPASAPEFTFSSVPDLPDDEILARVLFQRSISELSPLQVARLAAAVGELSGRTGGGIFEQIRQATGLDDLDFQTAEDGTTSVQAGKYIQENVYSTIEADNLGNSKATINLDISDTLTARGSVGNDGETSIGIFFEKDY